MKTKTNLLFAAFVALLLLTTAATNDKTTTIFIIGDSTAANKDLSKGKLERGWGMALQCFFDDNIVVDNHAANGRTSLTFFKEGRWQKVLQQLKPGDYVVIQFGHNDEKLDTARHTEPGSTFDDNLRRFARETLQRGAHPILMNAVVRRNFFQATDGTAEDEALRNTKYEDEQVNSDTLIDTHGAYLLSPRRVAEELGVVFVDANRITHDLEQGLGVEGSRRLHMWFRPGEVASIPNGRHDNTHYNVYGAHVVANLLADAIGREVPSLRRHIRHYDYVVSAEGRGNYLSLQEAIDAVPSTDNKTVIRVLDGDVPASLKQSARAKRVKVVR